MKLHIDNLLLSLENPRLEESDSEQQEIMKMIQDQGKKIVNLAKDICEYGTNPLDSIAVYPSDFEEDKYIVAEGNRRVTALKLLYNSELFPMEYRQKYKSIYDDFINLREKYEVDAEIECTIFRSQNDKNLIHWIEIKHNGENKGRGTASWSAIQKARWKKKQLGEDLLLDFWMDLEALGILNADQISEITKTNWERILRVYGLKFLGLRKVGNKLIIPQNDIIEFQKKMRIVHRDLSDKSVGTVYDQEKIEQFFNDISVELYGHPCEDNKANQIKLPLDKETTEDMTHDENSDKERDDNEKLEDTPQPEEENDEEDEDINQPPVPNTNAKKKKDLFQNCDTVIPSGLKIQSDNVRINQIIKELKLLKVDIYPNSCGMLLRNLFELSAKWYLERIDKEDHTDDQFQFVLNKTSRLLFEENRINGNEKSALNQDVDNLRLLFNGYAHNTDSYPSSETIKNKFKAHLKYLMVVLGNDWPID